MHPFPGDAYLIDHIGILLKLAICDTEAVFGRMGRTPFSPQNMAYETLQRYVTSVIFRYCAQS
jgi:hypothetical protein